MNPPSMTRFFDRKAKFPNAGTGKFSLMHRWTPWDRNIP